MANARYPSAGDANGFAHFSAEVYTSMMRNVTVFPWSVKNPDVTLYGEDMEQEWREENSYVAQCYIEALPGKKSKVTPEGVDQERPLTLVFDKELIQGRKQKLPDIGYLIFLKGEYYRIMQVNPIDWFANTNRALAWVVKVIRYRQESVSRGEVKGDHQP